MTSGGWLVRLSAAAEADYSAILRWTAQQFGRRQEASYAKTLAAAVAALTAGPGIPGARTRPELGEGLYTLHIARGGGRGRHFVLFREREYQGRAAIEVIRILHDAMDLARHLPPEGT